MVISNSRLALESSYGLVQRHRQKRRVPLSSSKDTARSQPGEALPDAFEDPHLAPGDTDSIHDYRLRCLSVAFDLRLRSWVRLVVDLFKMG